jgi:hypothetical protein
MSKEFDRWFQLWDQTHDPEVRRLCEISWRASRAYCGVEQAEAEDKFVVALEIDRILREHWLASDEKQCGTQTGYDWLAKRAAGAIGRTAKPQCGDVKGMARAHC